MYVDEMLTERERRKGLREFEKVHNLFLYFPFVCLFLLKHTLRYLTLILFLQITKYNLFWQIMAFPCGSVVKNLPAMRDSWEDPLEKGKATHSSILAWRIPWTV